VTNLIVANYLDNNPRYNFQMLETLIKAQIDNSIELSKQVTLVTNFDYEYMGVRANKADLNTHCATGSKMFAVKWLFENTDTDTVWAHDLDCWQNIPFECPEFKDVGIACYSNSKRNGGSVFWRRSAKDIIDNVVKAIIDNKLDREEPILNLVLNEYKDRTTILNHTYNVGCSGFMVRYLYADKPIKVVHLHPTNRIAWETHVLDRSGLGITLSPRLEKLIRKHYPNLSVELSEKGRKRRAEKIRRMYEKNQKCG